MQVKDLGESLSRHGAKISRHQYRLFAAVAAALMVLIVVWTLHGSALDTFNLRPAHNTNHDQAPPTTDMHNGTHEADGQFQGTEEDDDEALKHGVGDDAHHDIPHIDHLPENVTVVPEMIQIPKKIWQIGLPKSPLDTESHIDPKGLQDTPTWLALNPDYEYTIVGKAGGEELLDKHYADQPKVREIYHGLANVGMKSDLLRYLILETIGGTYTDTDTIALRPIDRWVPPQFEGKVGLIVGIEFDQRDNGPWADILHPLQFCQWTIAAAPGHPVFRKMIDRVLWSVQKMAVEHQSPVSLLMPSSTEVMNSTGPAAWTDAVFDQLKEFDPSLNSVRDLAYMTEPRLIGDVLVLSIDGFGMGQPHSASTNDGSIPEAALMRHLFRGSWRG
ncbi:unnamed protein product [Clonostachys rhizophaga]|uniref:Initiation-specific alpha-1,6-mannosyltransferase n=1 Tax=Clonostachys rhizophaga TaxID=160324 RepID=A0A9N9YKM9_9HYPO|nr:unnamed protein product [Clonostachys rhizophaga]